jgi:hypothetical protein
MDGFVYDQLGSFTDAKTRLAWLNKQSKPDVGLDNDGKDFKPQPWRQLQKVLHKMGHVEDAQQVAIAFEDRLRAANLIGQSPPSWNKQLARMYRHFCRFLHCLFGKFYGYGYRPIYLFLWMVAVWLFCGAFYWRACTVWQ